ncbi:hypothetical protein [Agromyces sp. Marseille-P2726]|uniref:hypothetical protein n=1 Tax=Agromyces sp. Marseille-P2726 TaxID=2709132 RepID=UPI0015705793|nr:hypothetical protein [Agromyces sp. Marseille-P2726]
MTYPRDAATMPISDPADPFSRLESSPTTSPVPLVDAADPWRDDPHPRTAEQVIIEVVERQHERFGGVKIGSAFFGWLITVAVAVLLLAIVAVTGVVLGFDVVQRPSGLVRDIPLDADLVVWIGIGSLFVLLLLAFYCGGYVAGRMARFSGVVQGLAVWAWALASATVLALVALLLGGLDRVARYAAELPPLPVSDDLLAIALVAAAVVAVVVSLGGAMLGGSAGVRYHRRVDLAGMDA